MTRSLRFDPENGDSTKQVPGLAVANLYCLVVCTLRVWKLYLTLYLDVTRLWHHIQLALVASLPRVELGSIVVY